MMWSINGIDYFIRMSKCRIFKQAWSWNKLNALLHSLFTWRQSCERNQVKNTQQIVFWLVLFVFFLTCQARVWLKVSFRVARSRFSLIMFSFLSPWGSYSWPTKTPFLHQLFKLFSLVSSVFFWVSVKRWNWNSWKLKELKECWKRTERGKRAEKLPNVAKFLFRITPAS